MTSPASLKLAVRFAMLVARASDSGAAEDLRSSLRSFGRQKRTEDLVLRPGEGGVLLLGGDLVEGLDDGAQTAACALLASRFARYGVEEITLTPRAADADLYELVRLLAAEPPDADPVGYFAARSSAVDTRSIPRRLAKRVSAAVEAVPEVVEPRKAVAPNTVASAASAPAASAPAASAPAASAPEPLAPEAAAPIEDTRSDRLTESLEIPDTADVALAALFARLQTAESSELLTEPLDELAVWIDLAFRQGKHDALVEGMAGLVAIEHQQLEKDPSDERRRAFARIIRQLAKPLLLRQLAVLRHRRFEDTTMARRTQAVLYRFGTDGAEALFDEYVSVATLEARAVCLEALRAIRRTHDALFALVRDTRDLVVRQAAGLLGELGDPRGEQMLIELIRHPDARARRAAVAALTHFQTSTALDGIGLALDDESPVVRARAVAALGEMGGVRVVSLLAPLLDREEDREVLYSAVAALGKIGGPEAVAVLIPCAQGESAHPRKRSASYRIAACTALVAIRSPQGMACVQALREDRDREVRDAAVRLVAQASRRTVAVRAVATS